jgi:hypothetical protein
MFSHDAKKDLMVTIADIVNNPLKYVKDNEFNADIVKKVDSLSKEVFDASADKNFCGQFITNVTYAIVPMIQNGIHLSNEQIENGINNINQACSEKLQVKLPD